MLATFPGLTLAQSTILISSKERDQRLSPKILHATFDLTPKLVRYIRSFSLGAKLVVDTIKELVIEADGRAARLLI